MCRKKCGKYRKLYIEIFPLYVDFIMNINAMYNAILLNSVHLHCVLCEMNVSMVPRMA